MLKPFALLSVFALATLAACEVSTPRGGGMAREDGFRVIAPSQLVLQQGAIQTVNLTIARGDLFKQDVKLSVKASPGINVDPVNSTVKASEQGEALVKVGAARDAALGEYRVTVTGTPANGEPTMTEFRVKVVTP